MTLPCKRLNPFAHIGKFIADCSLKISDSNPVILITGFLTMFYLIFVNDVIVIEKVHIIS